MCNSGNTWNKYRFSCRFIFVQQHSEIRVEDLTAIVMSYVALSKATQLVIASLYSTCWSHTQMSYRLQIQIQTIIVTTFRPRHFPFPCFSLYNSSRFILFTPHYCSSSSQCFFFKKKKDIGITYLCVKVCIFYNCSCVFV